MHNEWLGCAQLRRQNEGRRQTLIGCGSKRDGRVERRSPGCSSHPRRGLKGGNRSVFHIHSCQLSWSSSAAAPEANEFVSVNVCRRYNYTDANAHHKVAGIGSIFCAAILKLDLRRGEEGEYWTLSKWMVPTGSFGFSGEEATYFLFI